MVKQDNRVVTGPAVVIVETTDKVRDNPVAVPVRRGEELPDNLADGQLERLEALGAFLTPAEHRASMVAGPQSSRLAEPDPVESGVVATPASIAHNTAPEGDAVQTPGVTPLEDQGDVDREAVDEAAQTAHNTAEPEKAKPARRS